MVSKAKYWFLFIRCYVQNVSFFLVQKEIIQIVLIPYVVFMFIHIK